MTARRRMQGRLALPINGLVEIAVALPNDREQGFVVPAAWIGAPIQERLPNAFGAVYELIVQGPDEMPLRTPPLPPARENLIRAALEADRAAVHELIAGVVARRLMTVAESMLPTERRKLSAPDACLRVATSLTGDLLKDGAYLDKLARWIGVTVSAWAAEDRSAGKDLIGRRLAYLIAVQGEDSAGTLADLLLPPNRPPGYLESLLGIGTAVPQELTQPEVPPGTLVVLSTGHFQGIREALYKNTFQHVEGTPWPTAQLARGGTKGYAQLRPAVMDTDPALPAQRVEAWVQTMWRQQSELSDLDADGLDALCAIYLNQARAPDDAAVADVDEILAMRGLKPKRGGQGRRGGYEPEQRAEMVKALSHIQNLWIDIGEVKVYENDSQGRRAQRATIKTLQSRPFIITDRMGQVRLDGYLDVERFIFRPGKAFAAFLFGAGRETGLLFQKALQYDPLRRKWEKRLTRYISWQWRTVEQSGEFVQSFRVSTLLEAVGEQLNERYPTKTRARLERALQTLEQDGVLARWRYLDWRASDIERRNWGGKWLQGTISVEAPVSIREYYSRLKSGSRPSTDARQIREGHDLAERLRMHRRALGFSQSEAAARLGIRQGYFSKLERGKVAPSANLKRQIEVWLGE
jgi:DNA-binding XRE family transcriptional regulator